MDAFTIGAVWAVGIVADGLLAIGIVTVASGRPVINLQRTRWSVREARLLGWCSIIQGIAAAVYSLYGGLSLGAHVLPLYWVGSPGGVFATAPFAVVMLATLFIQAGVQLRHQESRRQLDT